MSNQYPNVFSPLRIGSMEVKNRLFVSAHSTNFVVNDPSGYNRWSIFSDRAKHYFAERAKGGFGLVMIGQTEVHPQSGIARPAGPGSFWDEAVPIYSRIAEAVHEHGAKVIVQLAQTGREKGQSGTDSWEPIWGPSSGPPALSGTYGEMNKEMDEDDIRSLIEGFVKSSRNAQEAGLDGVELHAGHPHLLGEWLTPAYNRRTDRYGGSLENRLRLVIEIVDEVRKACGRGLVVGVRINGEWRMPGGQTLEESIEVSRCLEATGKVDFINVTGWPGPLGIAPTGAPRGQLVPFAEAIKKATEGIAVFSIGRIVDPGHAERIVASGQADMVGMTRASIADPELPNKALEGRLDDIRRCIGAGQGCLGRNSLGRPITCTQNPTVGREEEWGIGTLQPAAKPKRVLVAGGGPAGMEAAIVAARRGHEVTLCEARDVLGGQVNLITRSPRRDEFAWVVQWRERQLASLGVTVRLGAEVTLDLVHSVRPDAVVVATGSTARPRGWYPPLPHLPSIPGSDQDHVFTYADALEGAIAPGKRVVLVDGLGYYQSSDALEYLLASGCQVTAVTANAQVTGDMYHHEREAFMQTVREHGGTVLPFTVVHEIRPTAVAVEDQVSGEESTLSGVDAVVLSLGNDPNDGLYRTLQSKVGELYRIGDCVTPRRIEHAVFEGHRTGREL